MKIKTPLRIAIIVTFSLVLLSIATITGLFALKYIRHNTLPPATYVSQINVSGKTPDEALHILENLKNEYLEKSIKFTHKNTSILLPVSKLGIDFKTEETIKMIKPLNAHETSLFDFHFKKKEKNEIPLLVKIDSEKLFSLLDESFGFADIHAQSANFYFEPEDDSLQIRDAIEGFSISRENVLAKLSRSAQTLKSTNIEIELERELPLLTADDLLTQKDDIMKKLNNKLTLVDPIYIDNWTIKLIDYPDWVIFEAQENFVAIKINKSALDLFIDEEISKWLDVPSQDVKIFTDENNEIVIEGIGQDGIAVLRDLLAYSIEKATAEQKSGVVVPIKKITPIFEISEDLQALGIRERISVGHTSYYGSPSNRIHNIKVGANRFNGKLIAPGEEFSFNNTLGPVNASTGYKQELVIKKDGTKPEYGGGLCQVSTTMYRTILFGGFPVTARRPHSYAVSYYSQVLGHGLDATIYLGGQDLRFINDTEKHLLIQAYVQNNYELFITFYGASGGRVVELEGPYLSNYHSPGPTVYVDTPTLPKGKSKQVENRHTGFNAVWYRYITDKEGNTTKEKIFSGYRAIPARVLVGTGGN